MELETATSAASSAPTERHTDHMTMDDVLDTSEKLVYSEQNRNREGQWGKWKGVICGADGCDQQAVCRGMCAKHYSRKRWIDGHRSTSDGYESRRNARLKHRYGITAADYDAMYASQGGCCAICRKPAEAGNSPAHWTNKLAVDHCHDTGKVRGLLCNDCNAGIGHLGTESVALAAAGYLRLHTG